MITDVDILGPWAWKLMGCGAWSPEGRSALGELDDNGSPKWAVIYDNYNTRSIQMHVAISDPKYVTRRAISACFEYPFEQLGVEKVLGFVDGSNTAALALDLRLGFVLEHIIQDAYEMGDMYILSMSRQQCRWLRGIEDGKPSLSSAAA